MKKFFLAGLLALAITASSKGSIIITQWDFGGVSGTLTPNVDLNGGGTANLVGGTTATFATGVSGQGWNTSTYAAQGTGSGTRGASFLSSTSGFQDIVLSFDHRASGTASRWAQLDITTDGGTNWTTGVWNNGGGLSPHDTFYNFSINLSSLNPAVENASGFGFRIVSIFSPQAFDQNSTLAPFGANSAYMRANAAAVYSPNNSTATGDYATSGTWRFDNVTIRGSVVPEPSSLALVLLVSTGCSVVRFRKCLKS